MPSYVLKCEGCAGYQPFQVHEDELPQEPKHELGNSFGGTARRARSPYRIRPARERMKSQIGGIAAVNFLKSFRYAGGYHFPFGHRVLPDRACLLEFRVPQTPSPFRRCEFPREASTNFRSDLFSLRVSSQTSHK